MITGTFVNTANRGIPVVRDIWYTPVTVAPLFSGIPVTTEMSGTTVITVTPQTSSSLDIYLYSKAPVRRTDIAASYKAKTMRIPEVITVTPQTSLSRYTLVFKSTRSKNGYIAASYKAKTMRIPEVI